VLETPYENLNALIQTTHTYPVRKTYPIPRRSSVENQLSIPAGQAKPSIPACSSCHSCLGIIPQIRQAVVDFSPDNCRSLCERAVETGIDPSLAVDQGLAAGMEQAGDLFARDIYFIPELLRCTDTLYAGLDVLKPQLARGHDTQKIKASLMIGVVQGDIHEIGKNLVIAMFTAAGWEVHDLGTDVSSDAFVKAYQEYNPTLVGISALMNTSMRYIETIIDALKVCDPDVRVMVGGAPLNEKKAREFGAHGYAPNAVQAVKAGLIILQLD
jgi:methanogenic corrinoid protein MtbC1